MKFLKIVSFLVLVWSQLGVAIAAGCIDQFTACRKSSDERIFCKDFYTGETRELPATLHRKFQNSEYQECVPPRTGETNRPAVIAKQTASSESLSLNKIMKIDGLIEDGAIEAVIFFVIFAAVVYFTGGKSCPNCKKFSWGHSDVRTIVTQRTHKYRYEKIFSNWRDGNGMNHLNFNGTNSVPYYEITKETTMKCVACGHHWTYEKKEKEN